MYSLIQKARYCMYLKIASKSTRTELQKSEDLYAHDNPSELYYTVELITFQLLSIENVSTFQHLVFSSPELPEQCLKPR